MGLIVLRIVHWEGKLSYSCMLSFTIVKNGYIKFYAAKMLIWVQNTCSSSANVNVKQLHYNGVNCIENCPLGR